MTGKKKACVILLKAETPAQGGADIARGTTGQLSTNPGTGFRHSGNNPVGQAWTTHLDRIPLPADPTASVNPAVDYARKPENGNVHVEPEAVRYSSLRVLQRIKSRDQKKGINAKYDAPALRSVLSARGVRQDEQHWAGLGEGTATDGKHSIDHWIDHASKHLPRFYSVENPSSADDFSDYSVWNHLHDVGGGTNIKVNGKPVDLNANPLGMTHVNAFTAVHSDTHPDYAPAEEKINRRLIDKDFYHQIEDHPTEVGHYRRMDGPASNLAHIIPSSHLHEEMDPYAGKMEGHLQWALDQLAPDDSHWGTHINHTTSDEAIDKLIHRNNAFKIPSDELGDVLSDMEVDHVPSDVSEQRKLYKNQLTKVSDQLKSWRDQMHSIYEQWPKEGKHEHIEEVQSDYFQHPHAYSIPGDKTRDEHVKELGLQLEPLREEAENRRDNRKRFYQNLGIQGPGNDMTLFSGGAERRPAPLGLNGFPAHSLQELLADLHLRQGLDLSVADKDIAKHVNDVSDKAIQQYSHGEMNIPESSPRSDPKLKQIQQDQNDSENASFAQDVNDLRNHTKHLDNSDIESRVNNWVARAGTDYYSVNDMQGKNPRRNTNDGSDIFTWPEDNPSTNNNRGGWVRDQFGRLSLGSDYGRKPISLKDLSQTLLGVVYGTDRKGYIGTPHLVNGVAVPDLHWTRGVINRLDDLGKQISDRASSQEDRVNARNQIHSYLDQLMRPYIENGERQLPSDVDTLGDPKYNLSSTIAHDDPTVRSLKVRAIADSIASLYKPKTNVEFPDRATIDSLVKKDDEARSLPVNQIYPVEQRHQYEANPDKENNALERPLRDPETAIRFMIRHAIANAINRGADHISIAPPGQKNGKYDGKPQPNSFWERLGNIRRDEVAKFAREHGAELKYLPWIQGSTVPLFSVNDRMRKHIAEHGIHAFDNGLPSTIDRVTKAVSATSVIVFGVRRKTA